MATITPASPSGVSLFIEPPSHHFTRDRLFEPDVVPFAGDQLMAPYAHLRTVLNARGIDVHTADALPDAGGGGRNIYVSIGNLSRCASLAKRADVTLSAFFAMECPVNDPLMYRRLRRKHALFRRIYSWSDAASLEPYVGARLELQHFCWPQSFSQVHEKLWSGTDRKFLVIMNGNKLPALSGATLHAQRLLAIQHFGRTGEIDLYGREWDQPPHRVGFSRRPYTVRVLERRARAWWQTIRPDPLLVAARRAWRGPANSKSQTLANYKFAICFENMVMKGWITEKLFDCFFTGTIPVYLGAPDIEQYVPPECYVDMRRFGGFRELHEYLRAMSDAEAREYREAARRYLASPAFHQFSKEAFADIYWNFIRQDADIA